jgi:hypothetical protein
MGTLEAAMPRSGSCEESIRVEAKLGLFEKGDSDCQLR